MLNKGIWPVPASDKWGYNAPWVWFSKSQWKRGGGVCCAEERFVGRLLPLVSLPLIVLPPSCLFLEILWVDLQARGLEVHMFEQRKLLGLFTHVWFEQICLIMFLFAYIWTYLFAHDLLHMFMNIFVCSWFVSICLNIFVCSWFVFAHVWLAYVWTYLSAHDLLHINSKG